jgi:hypothetical protein
MAFYAWLRRCWEVLSHPLSTLQATIGFFAGLISVGSVVLSFLGILHASPGHGDVVAIVQEARSQKPVADAVIEILTPQDALITTLASPADGRARKSLKEGQYRLRVSHPRFAAETRQIQVQAGQTAEIRIALGLRGPGSAAGKAVDEGVGAVRRFFHDLAGR